MSLRASFLFSVISLAVLPAIACDMDLDHRGETVADYIETVGPCLYATPLGYEFDQDMEQDFVRRVNQARLREGLPALYYRVHLRATSRFHSLDMAVNDFFGHVSPNGREPHNRVSAFDRRALVSFSAENVAMIEIVNGRWNLDRDAVERLHKNLMDSPGHRANILSEEATHIAVGVVKTDTGVWVTQTFLALSGSLAEDVPVRMYTGQRVNQAPVLDGWSFQGFEAVRKDGNYLSIRQGIPQGLSGDIGLVAYGRKPGDKPLSFYTIHLPGPAITVGG